jgi:hypothetical protein
VTNGSKLEGASFVSKSKTWVDFAEEARGHRAIEICPLKERYYVSMGS